MGDAPRLHRSGCPIAYALDVIGDRWSLLVLRDMILRGRRHYREFAEPEGVATNILSARLRKLEQDGVITRRPDPENRRQVIYEPTDKGLELAPLLVEALRWGLRYAPNCSAPPSFREKIEADPDAFTRSLVEQARGRRNSDS